MYRCMKKTSANMIHDFGFTHNLGKQKSMKQVAGAEEVNQPLPGGENQIDIIHPVLLVLGSNTILHSLLS